MKKIINHNRTALYGGLATMVFVGLIVFLLGNTSNYEAKVLIESLLPGFNVLCNTITLASATILALLLTLLAAISAIESKLKNEFYESILSLAKFSTILFVGALILFQIFNIPLVESDDLPLYWFGIIYWVLLISSAVLSGFMVSVILMLYTSIVHTVSIIGLGNHPYIVKDDEEEKIEK